MANQYTRTKSFETKLFEEFDDEKLLEAAKQAMLGKFTNTTQLNFVMDLIKQKLEKEKTEGHVNVELMSLVDVAKKSLEDDTFVETIGKALEAKKRILKGKGTMEGAYNQVKEAVNQIATDRDMTAKDVNKSTQHYLSGEFDKELESNDSEDDE